MKRKSLLSIFCLIMVVAHFSLYAQTDTTRVKQEEEEFDFSEFADDFEVATDDSGKKKATKFADQKVLGLSPTKLISVEYDFQGSFDMTSSGTGFLAPASITEHTGEVLRNHGFRLQANFPVISRNNIILNLGTNLWDSRYDFSNMTTNPNAFQQRLHGKGLRTAGVNFTLFKPLNAVNYLIFQGQADLNGNYNFGNVAPDFSLLKYSGAVVFGWKKNEQLSYGFGVTRTYRGGEVLHIPVVLYNHTFNDKWGVEALLPARASLRRTFSARSMFMLGYELEGGSYHMQFVRAPFDTQRFDAAELRKSEIRVRLSWEKSLSDFYWVTLQAGYRIMYKFDLSEQESADSGDFIVENIVPGAIYFRLGLNFVSP